MLGTVAVGLLFVLGTLVAGLLVVFGTDAVEPADGLLMVPFVSGQLPFLPYVKVITLPFLQFSKLARQLPLVQFALFVQPEAEQPPFAQFSRLVRQLPFAQLEVVQLPFVQFVLFWQPETVVFAAALGHVEFVAPATLFGVLAALAFAEFVNGQAFDELAAVAAACTADAGQFVFVLTVLYAAVFAVVPFGHCAVCVVVVFADTPIVPATRIHAINAMIFFFIFNVFIHFSFSSRG